MKKSKERVFTFKADAELASQLEKIPNKSEFIRQSLNASLAFHCPLCRGTGSLSQAQQKHWHDFLANHSVEKCSDCKALMLVCQQDDKPGLHGC